MIWSDDYFDPDNMTRATQALRLARMSGDVICVKICASGKPFEVEGNDDGINVNDGADSDSRDDAMGRGTCEQVGTEERVEGVFPMACPTMA